MSKQGKLGGDEAEAPTVRMSVDIAGVQFKNPVLTASGTFAYGLEFAHLMDLDSIGGIVVKGISMTPIKGNPPPRIYETPSGMLNAIGWQNIGAMNFVKQKLPALRNFQTKIVVNIVGFDGRALPTLVAAPGRRIDSGSGSQDTSSHAQDTQPSGPGCGGASGTRSPQACPADA